jgi:hypothetical protein
LTVSNHKDIAAEIVVEINNYRGDNVKLIYGNQGVNIEKISASLWKIKRVFQPN